ncbi:YegP family protein [Microbacterium sp. B35-30]|uniref:YegP family protein n=1 Tax=Microbacterium sp. B35-30 TaxID=1962642 RepID=UPI0013D2ACFB|nr:YegP family protein [Microbacterium sp. B35-30]KAF2417604.1 hypothetical protein B2K11_11775 [Microbacterium sp. B35-30]
MGKFEIKRAANGIHYYWTLKAPNNEVIATSEMYLSKASAENGIRSVKLYAPTASVHDTTSLARRF